MSARHSATPGMVSTGSRRFHCYHGDYLGTCRFLRRSRRGGTARAEHPARYPDRRIIVTTVTETGREAVEQRLAGIAEHRYMPLDFPWVVAAVLRIFQPSLFLCVETELWPNLLRALARRGVPVLLVNGRLSSQSYRGYRFIRPLMQQMLASVTHCLMQSRRDAERITALGAPAERVICTGNIKFDQPLPHLQDTDADSLRALLLAGQEDLLVAGSTHPGEEDQVLACYQRVVQQHPTLVLLIAPRHIERVGQLEAAAKARGLIVVRRSVLATGVSVQGPRVVILDTRGELAAVYRDAVVAFVGGTLVPVGGHHLGTRHVGKAGLVRPLYGSLRRHCRSPHSGGRRQTRADRRGPGHTGGGVSSRSDRAGTDGRSRPASGA